MSLTVPSSSSPPARIKPPLLATFIGDATEVAQTLVSTGSNTEQAQGQIAQDIQNITNSLANNTFATQFAHGGFGTIIAGFALHTAVEWKSRTESDNIIRVVFIASLMLLACAYKALSWHKEKHALLLQTAEKNKKNINDLIKFKAVLEEFYKMACICTTPDPDNNLPSLFANFLNGINSLPANIVPNFLTSRWKEVELIVNKPNSGDRQKELINYMTVLMFPYIKYYAREIDRKLTETGYILPSEQKLDLEALENIGGKIQPLPQYPVVSRSNSSGKEKEVIIDDLDGTD